MYIIDQNRQNQLIREMVHIRKDMENYSVFFHHTLTDQMWKSFFPRASGENFGPKILRHEPLPDSLTEHISICLTEEEPENAIGLGIELSAQIERWPDIIRILEKNRKIYKSKQVRLFLKHLRINRFRDHIKELDINPDELELSEKELKKLRRKTWNLRLKSFLL